MTWQIASFGILAVVLGGGFLWYERRRPPARVLALVAALAALAVVGRLAFAAFPNVKPTTDIVLFAGYALGGVPGFAVGAITALVSNVFLSQGPWTPWQMVGWGGVGVAGAGLAWAARGRELGRVQLAIACGVAAAAFGELMDVYQWTLAARQDLDSYLAIAVSSAPYHAAHVIGSVVFCLLIGPAFLRALRRYQRRLEVRWDPRPARGAAAALVVALAVVVGSTVSAAPAAASAKAAATPAAGAVAYLLQAQNADGGFGPAAKSASTTLHSGWVSFGLMAAGRNPHDVKRKRGRSAAAYIARTAGALSDIGELERTIVVVEAAGLSARSFGGRDLVAEVLKRRRADGSFANFVSYTAFGILALRAAGEQVGSATVSWLRGSQNADGGFGLVRGGTSDADMTGMVLQALAAVGRSMSPATRRAVDYLHGIQAADGGFGQMAGRDSNAQSTTYAVQGLVAVGADDAVVDKALRYLVGLQRSDGSIAYSSTSTQTPVWVTGQALLALRKAPFPLDPVKRKPRPQKPKPSKAASEESQDSGAGGGTGAPSAGAPAAAPPAPSPEPAVPDGGSAGGAAATTPLATDTAPAPTPLPQSVPTPDPDPADAASAQRAAAGAGDDGVPRGRVIGGAVAVVALLTLLWLLRRRIVALMRRGGALLPGKLRRSSST